MSELTIYEKLRDVLEEKAALKIAQAITEAVSFYEKIVTKDEFIELKIIVKDLLEAQKRAEERLTALEEKMAELAEAQRKTEQRVNELAEAQKRTEESLNKLIGVVEDLKEQMGGHSHTIGHILEDKAIAKLPKILKERYGIEIEGKLKRGYLENDREEMEEINVFGFGKKDGQRILILGEGKSRFSKNDLKDLQKKVSRFKKRYEVFPVIITYIFSSYKVEEEVKEKGLATFLSFEFEE